MNSPSPPIAPVVEETWVQLDANHWARGCNGSWRIANGIYVPAAVLRKAAAAPSTAEAASKMLSALEEVREIIKDAAMAGFNIESGNWPERLFASQQITKAAVDAARAAGIKSPLPEPQSGEHP